MRHGRRRPPVISGRKGVPANHSGPRFLTLSALFLVGIMGVVLACACPVSVRADPYEETAHLLISVNMTEISVEEGDYFPFHTVITNNETETTLPLVAHLNVASLQEGLYVDPEDWSEERTIFVDPIEPGATANISWRIHALFAGNFAVYVVVLSQDTSSTPVVSDEIHVHIDKWEVLQIADVTPVVTAVPVLLGVLYACQRSWLALHLRRTNDPRSR